MSAPISRCTISKAAFGDQKAFEWLVEAEEYNRSQFAFTIFPCECDPPCPVPTREQSEDLRRRVDEAIAARFKARYPNGLPPIPKFDKWIFPVIKNMRPPWWKRFWNRVRGRPSYGEFDLRKILLAQPMGDKNENRLHRHQRRTG